MYRKTTNNSAFEYTRKSYLWESKKNYDVVKKSLDNYIYIYNKRNASHPPLSVHHSSFLWAPMLVFFIAPPHSIRGSCKNHGTTKQEDHNKLHHVICKNRKIPIKSDNPDLVSHCLKGIGVKPCWFLYISNWQGQLIEAEWRIFASLD